MRDEATDRPAEMPRRSIKEKALVGAGIVSGTAIIGSASLAMSNPHSPDGTLATRDRDAGAAPQSSETVTADEIDDHLTHAESNIGMFGLMTALVVE